MNWTKFFLAMLSASLLGCTKPEHRETKAFLRELEREIREASFIEVVEHSDMMDFPDHAFAREGERSSDEVPKIEYTRLRLSEDRKRELLETVEAMDGANSAAISFCSFVPHHTIEFHAASGKISQMEICFQCSGFSWDKVDLSGSPPEWVDALEQFIQRIEMSPRADWRDRAEMSGKVPRRR